MAITKTYDLLNINGVKGWVRDSWARRAIASLQQAIANIVVPTKTSDLTNDSGFITQADVPPGSTASSTVPNMDGVASVGTENAFARGDHRHPSDTNKADKATTLSGYGIIDAYTKSQVDGMIPTVPTKTSDLTNDSDFQTGTQVGNAISAEAGFMIPYGYCTTGASTVAKVVTVSPAVTELTTGLTIAVKMQYANTGSNPTLNVNSLGAKAIKRYGTTAAGTSAAANWNANSVVILVYDGTYWQLADWNNTTYSGMTDAEYQAGTSTTNRLITPARLKAAVELHAPVQSVNGQDGDVTISVPTKTSELTNDSGFITGYTETDPTVPAWAKASTKPSYTAAEVGALPDDTVIPTVPTKISAFQNDTGYITGFTETDPTVPAWAKASTKPTYTASEVGALPDTTEIPSKTSDLTNDSGFITASSVPSAYTSNPSMDGTASAGSSAAWARGDHRHPTDTSRQAALSSTQLAAVNSGVTAAKVQEWDSIVVPTKTSELTNDSGFITSVPVQSVNGKTGTVNLGAVDVGALPNSTVIPTVPSNVSAFTNDAGYITASDVPDAAASTPVMDGTGAAGSSADYARADHVHPHDTSKQDALSTAQLAAVDSGITTEKVASYEQNTALTLTRAENSYVNATNFARLECRKIGPHLAILHLNLRLNAALSGTSFVTIGSVAGISLPYPHFSTVQSDDATGMLAVQINEAGAIRLMSSNAPASKWYRTEIPLLLN